MAKEKTDLERAVDTLAGKQLLYNRLWQYYDGIQPLRYSTEKLKEIFKGINARFTMNWCEVVVNSIMERLDFEDYVVVNDDASTISLNDWWDDNDMDIEADDIHLCALVTGEAFVIAWPVDETTLGAFYNDSRLINAFYQAENPKQMRYAAKWWLQDDCTMRLTLYYPDRLEYYATEKEIKVNTQVKAKLFLPLPVEGGEGEFNHIAANPFAAIPVFHFRRERRAIKSELGPSILDVQDAVNKLFSDMMVSSEFGAFRQRYVISNADTGSLKNAPNEIWDIPAGDGLGQDHEVGELSATELNNFMRSIIDLSVAISKMSRTPQSLFFLGARADPSGEALIAMEAPINKKTSKYITRFSATWVQLAKFVVDVARVTVAGRITAVYDDPRTIQPLTQAQTRQTNGLAGIPLTTQLRDEGWTPQDLAQLETDKEAAAAAQQNAIAIAMLNAQRQFDQGEGET